MVDGDPESAQAVTHRTISAILHDGTTITKTILVSLDTPTETIAVETMPAELPAIDDMDQDERPEKTNSSRVRQLTNIKLS
jgi:hypothetical protein